MSVDERGRLAGDALHDSTREVDGDRMLAELRATRVRRTRAKSAAALVAVAVAIIGGSTVADIGELRSTEPADTSPNDERPDPSEASRLTVEDAVRFEPTVLHDQAVPVSRDGLVSVTYDGITEDGLVLVHRVVDPFAHQAGLFDPSTDEVTWFDPPPTPGGLGLGVPLLLDRNQLVFAQTDGEGRYVNAVTLDRTSGAWTKTRVDATGADPYPWPDDQALFLQAGWSPFLAADGRVWFRGGSNSGGSPPPEEWWSASLTESGPARLEEADVPGSFASGHGQLVSRVDVSGELVVRNIDGSGDWSVSPPEGCSYVGVSTTGDRVVTTQQCPDGGGVVAFDSDGNLVLEVSGAALSFEFDDDSLNSSVGISAPTRGWFYILDLEKPALYKAPAQGCQGHGFPPVTGGGLVAWCHDATPQVPVGQPAQEVTYRIAEIPTD